MEVALGNPNDCGAFWEKQGLGEMSAETGWEGRRQELQV